MQSHVLVLLRRVGYFIGYYKSTPLFLSFVFLIILKSSIHKCLSLHVAQILILFVFNFLKVVRKVDLQVGRCQIPLVGETLGQL